jgi:predicted phosphodiesterase
MRIAVVSDIHGNRTAFDAVAEDLRQVAPDLILHGGDLAQGGSSPVEIVDRICDLGWHGVAGNADEMLFRPDSLTEFASRAPGGSAVFAQIREMAMATAEELGDKRLAWLRNLPRVRTDGGVALVHASPRSLWHAPEPEATDGDLLSVYASLGQPIAIYGHIHRSFVRSVPGMIVVNTGSVGLPYDGDRRAAYLVLDDGAPTIRRVHYDVERELQLLADSRLPHVGWTARSLKTARL